MSDLNYVGAGRFMGVLANSFIAFPLAWAAWASRGLSIGGQDDVPIAILFAINAFGVGVSNILGYSLSTTLTIYPALRWTAVTLNATWLLLIGTAFLTNPVQGDIAEVFAISCLSVFALINLLAMYIRTPDPGDERGEG